MVSPRLSPHESPEVDVILLGHSLGGLVAADVALMLSENAAQKHRILGLMNFDALFLG
jgi:thioesterase domain-containing protein